MPAQKPQWFFQPRSHRNGAGSGDGDATAAVTTVPAAICGGTAPRARPGEGGRGPWFPVAAVHGVPRQDPGDPGGLVQDAPKVRAINEILDDVGMTLIPSRPEAPPRVHDPELARKLAQLPRVVTLAPARDNHVPAVVDAWIALQALRAAVTRSGNRKPAFRASSPACRKSRRRGSSAPAPRPDPISSPMRRDRFCSSRKVRAPKRRRASGNSSPIRTPIVRSPRRRCWPPRHRRPNPTARRRSCTLRRTSLRPCGCCRRRFPG